MHWTDEMKAKMMANKSFHIGDVLSVTTGRLVSKNGIGGVYDVLNWMTGESVYTHQLPRIAEEARPVLIAAHPDLAQADEDAEYVTEENWRDWLQKWEARYGETIEIPQFSEDQHERIDPLSELAEKVHPSRIAVVRAP